MEQKNLIVAMIASVLILLGWMWLQEKFWPRPRPKDKNAEKKGEARDKKGKEKAAQVKILLPWHSLGERKDLFLAALTVASRTIPLNLGDVALRLKEVPEVEPPAGLITLGKNPGKPPADKKFFLTAVLTTRGAGVQEVVLNNFEGADRLGRATGKKLALVPPDPFYPSFLMYHYPQAGDSNPVTTLGRRTWQFVSNTTDADGVQEVRFRTKVPPPFTHLEITKIYRLAPREYHIGLALEIQDTRRGKEAGQGKAFRYQLAGAHGLPLEGEWYTGTYRTAMIGQIGQRNNFLKRVTEDSRQISHDEGGDRVPEDQRGESAIQYAGVVNQFFGALIVVDDKQAPFDEGGVEGKDILAWARPTHEATEFRGRFHSLSVDKKRLKLEGGITFNLLPRLAEDPEQKSILENLKEGEPVVVEKYSEEKATKNELIRWIATHVRRGRELHSFTDDLTVRVHSEKIELKPGDKVVHKFLLYHGPVKIKLLNEMGADSPSADLVKRYADTLHLLTLTDYGSFGWWTSILITCTRIMHWLLYYLHFLVGSYGLSIFLLTVLVRGAMFPISRKQAYITMKMQELSPELKKVQEKYKNDPKGRTEATMELYRKHNVHPLGSCLPMLLQLPIFMGLYYCLQESVHFRLASFLWIDNLAAPDMLVWWSQHIPLISDPDNQAGGFWSFLYLGPYFNLLPVVAVAVMIVQQKVMTPPPADEQQEAMRRMMPYMMVFIGIMFYKVAAGLCLYFIASSLWGLAERKFLPKKAAAALPTPPAGGGKASTGIQRAKPRPTGKREVREEDGVFQKIKDWWAEVLKQARKK